METVQRRGKRGTLTLMITKVLKFNDNDDVGKEKN